MVALFKNMGVIMIRWKDFQPQDDFGRFVDQVITK